MRAVFLSFVFLLFAATAHAACDPQQARAMTVPAEPATLERLERHEKTIRDVRNDLIDTVVIGDSLAARWPEKQLLAAFGGTTSGNLGIPGDQVRNVLWRLDNTNLDAMKPKTAVLIVGTNNLKNPAQAPCAVALGQRELVKRLRTAWPYAAIVVVEVPPRAIQPDPDFEARRTEHNTTLKKLLASMENVRTLNVDDVVMCGATGPCPTFIKDGVHLSPEGYAKIAEMLKAAAVPAAKAP